MLNLPNIGRKWKVTYNSCRYYSLAHTIIPSCSLKYLQMVIPIIIGAFFHDIDTTRYSNSNNLTFIANLTPCNKILDECAYLNREYILYKYQITLNMEQWYT